MNDIVVANSVKRWVRLILFLQLAHLPRVISQFINGIRWRVLMTILQLGQRDFGPKYLPNKDSFNGRRYANRVAYEPKIAPQIVMRIISNIN